MRRLILLLALGLPLFAEARPAAAQQATGAGTPAAPERRGPPHDWAFGVWTGGAFPAPDTDAAACYANATVIILRDVVMRFSALDVAFRQRLIETVATSAGGLLEFRFVPPLPIGTPLGPRIPPDAGFSCEGGMNVLRVERLGPNEITFPDCREFPSPLKRCGSPAR
jgi:hypothetical protein